MTTGFLLAALVAVNVAFIALLDRRDRRDREERATLLQRIQAPHQAVLEHANRNAQGDEESMPMTDAMMAGQEAVEALERIARLEQADFDGRRI